MEWRKARQARRARVTASPPPREAEAAQSQNVRHSRWGRAPPACASFSRGLIDLQNSQPVPQHKVRPQPRLPDILAQKRQ